MANTDTVILNANGQTVREDIQTNLQAIKGNNSDSNLPAAGANTLINYMTIAQTGTVNQLKVHNGSSFHPLMDISQVSGFAGTHLAVPGSNSNPGYRFLNSSGTATQTGMGLPADDRIGFFHGASEKVSILSTGNVGIGTTAPISGLHVVEQDITIQRSTSTDTILNVMNTASDSSGSSYIDLTADQTYQDRGLRLMRLAGANTGSQIEHRGTGALQIIATDGGEIKFKLGNNSNNTSVVRWKFNSVGGFVWDEHTGGGSPISGDILPRGIVGKRGIAANANTSNLYNFYWDDSGEGTGKANHLEAWVDDQFAGDVSLVTSDYRIKRNVNLQTESGINKVKNLKPVTYQYKEYGKIFKDKEEIREGFIAHEVSEVIPSAVNREKDVENSLQTLNLDAIVSVLTKALQEAVAKIETLETKVAVLEGS